MPTWTSTALPWSSSATALGPPVSYWMLGPQAIVWLVKLTVPTRWKSLLVPTAQMRQKRMSPRTMVMHNYASPAP